VRLFIGISPSDDVRRSLVKMQGFLSRHGVNGAYLTPENLHMTLAFIGETDNPGAVKDAFKNISFKPFKLSFSEMGSFGDLIFVGIKGNQGLSSLVKSVREALDQVGIDYDRKKFKGHITIIRRSTGNWRQTPPPKGDMMVKEISLMKTTFKDGKPAYTELASF
jgi:2'-5' RNA ligase